MPHNGLRVAASSAHLLGYTWLTSQVQQNSRVIQAKVSNGNQGNSSPPDHAIQKSGTGVHRQNQQQRGRTGDMTSQFQSLCLLEAQGEGSPDVCQAEDHSSCGLCLQLGHTNDSRNQSTLGPQQLQGKKHLREDLGQSCPQRKLSPGATPTGRIKYDLIDD